MPPVMDNSRFCYRLCRHLKTNGVQCQSPALKDTNFCYFHGAMNRPRRKTDPFLLPALEDANAIQTAVQEVIEALLEKRIDNKRAGLLLYALQIASANLKRVNFEPYSLRDRAIREHDRQYYAELEKQIAARENGETKPESAMTNSDQTAADDSGNHTPGAPSSRSEGGNDLSSERKPAASAEAQPSAAKAEEKPRGGRIDRIEAVAEQPEEPARPTCAPSWPASPAYQISARGKTLSGFERSEQNDDAASVH